MRKFLAIISALILAFLVFIAVLFFQGKTIGDLFEEQPQNTLPLLPTVDPMDPAVLPELEDPVVDVGYQGRLDKGDLYAEQGVLSLAVNEYVEASKLEPDALDPYLKLVDAHLQLKNYSRALANAESALVINPNHLETQFNLILIHIGLSDFDKAKQLLDVYSSAGNETAEVLYYKGILSALYADDEVAKDNLNQALASSIEGSELGEKISRVLGAYEEFEVNQAAEILFLRQLIAKSFNENGEYEMAIFILKDVLKERDDLRDGWNLLAFAYLNLQQFEFAKTALDKSYSEDPTWPTTQYFLGVTHKALGNTQEAITYFSSVLDSNFEPRVIVQNHLADLYFENQEYTKAIEAYEVVLEVNQQSVDAFIYPVWLYIDYVNDPSEALALSETALSLFPDSAMAHNLVGWSHLANRDYEQAEDHLVQAVEMDPTVPAIHYNLGALREATDRVDQALSSYEQAYQLDIGGDIGNKAANSYNDLLQKTLTIPDDES